MSILLLRLQVYLNGTRLPIKSFADYCDMYLGPKDNGVPRIYERVNDRWEICVSATDGQFQQVCGCCVCGGGGGACAFRASGTGHPPRACVIV